MGVEAVGGKDRAHFGGLALCESARVGSPLEELVKAVDPPVGEGRDAPGCQGLAPRPETSILLWAACSWSGKGSGGASGLGWVRTQSSGLWIASGRLRVGRRARLEAGDGTGRPGGIGEFLRNAVARAGLVEGLVDPRRAVGVESGSGGRCHDDAFLY